MSTAPGNATLSTTEPPLDLFGTQWLDGAAPSPTQSALQEKILRLIKAEPGLNGAAIARRCEAATADTEKERSDAALERALQGLAMSAAIYVDNTRGYRAM
jgi:hypothetical protein